MIVLQIRQNPLDKGKYPIQLTLRRQGQADLTAQALIEFALTAQEQEDIRWYMEDYLLRQEGAQEVQIDQIELAMRARGEELYTKVLAHNMDTQAIWFAVREQLADLRIEIQTGIAEAASIPWELMRDPQSDSAIALRVRAFVRVQSGANISFVPVQPPEDGRVRLLYVVCRPGGRNDVELRAVANRLIQDLGEDLSRFDITALRPPTFEQLQKVLKEAKDAGRPFHIVHFDGHGIYQDLSGTSMAEWLQAINTLTLGGHKKGKHGYLLFEHPEEEMRPVAGEELGQLLHDTSVPVLVLNACQSAMHEAIEAPATDSETPANEHDTVRAIGSLTQAVIDHGIPAVLGMRYSVFVVTAAQYIGQLYNALAQGQSFGQAASEGRKHLSMNPDRWVGLEPQPLQDWFVPVVYEATPVHLLSRKDGKITLDERQLDPVQSNNALLRYVPDTGFVGRDGTLLLVDRAFDAHPVVLLHAYAGQGKTTTAVEFSRWYAQTGGLGEQPLVLFTSFENHTDLTDVLNQIGQIFSPILQASGIEWHALNDNAKRRGLVLQILKQVPVLWIWDNVEPVAGFPAGTASNWTNEEQAELADFLKQIKEDRGTKAKILLTSRRPEHGWLGGIPRRVRMPRMSGSDAAKLARSLGSDSTRKIARKDIANWQPLIDYCQGNPLTLRVLVGQAIRMRLGNKEAIQGFVESIRSGEQVIEDVDEAEGRDKSLGASLDYGFKNAFAEDEQPIIALLHLFQGTVDVDVLVAMGEGEDSLPELQNSEGEQIEKDEIKGMLERAREVGLLTHVADTWYSIHPALPWFLRQLFNRYYDGKDGRSSSDIALRAWVEAIGGLGAFYNEQFNEGNRGVIQLLALEEDNLLHARRTACQRGWWNRVIGTMQGLRSLYDYQGRPTEWARLVYEIIPDYCTPDDAPISGRENQYPHIMGYRVRLAREYDRDLSKASDLQERLVKWDRQRAASLLDLPKDAELDSFQRNRIRSLATSVFSFGQILFLQGSPDCVTAFEESIRHAKRIQDTAGEATSHYSLGNAYLRVPAIRNFDAAEASYRRELTLLNPNDLSGRASTINQIGMVHFQRFEESQKRDEPLETILKHVRAAEKHFREALDTCPVNALNNLSPIHNALGNLYDTVGETERAREHYEKDAQICEQTGDRFGAGQTRNNMALMYVRSAEREANPDGKRDLLERAKAYAEAALRDYQHFQGRLAAQESKVRSMLEFINESLAKML
ncbi:MAG: CHAT domain-containing protein [Bacteroidota bacterium]